MTRFDCRGYVLHARAYGETSLLVDVFTVSSGLLTAMARGGRGGGNRSKLQPFNALRFSLQGRRELKTLTSCELEGQQGTLVGDRLLMGLYVNELLMRLLGRFEPQTRAFAAYEDLLARLGSAEADAEVALRYFEFSLLSALGYGVSFEYDLQNDRAIEPGSYYRFEPELGFVAAVAEAGTVYSGADVLKAFRGDFESGAVRRLAKQVARSAIEAQLGGRPLRSRAMFTHRSGTGRPS